VVEHGRRGRPIGEGGAYDLVARFEADAGHGEMQGGGAAVHRNGVGKAHVGGELRRQPLSLALPSYG